MGILNKNSQQLATREKLLHWLIHLCREIDVCPELTEKILVTVDYIILTAENAIQDLQSLVLVSIIFHVKFDKPLNFCYQRFSKILH